MRHVVISLIAGMASLALLAGCRAEPAAEPLDPGNLAPPPAPPPVAAPPSPVPAEDRACPYLDKAFVSDANGQRVGRVSVSADTPTPACFFYRSDGKLQLSVQVYVGDAASAKALVDQAAPIATSNHADSPQGWTGGSLTTESGAVYAVAKAGTAVVVTTNQAQTIKARRVAERAIATLEL